MPPSRQVPTPRPPQPLAGYARSGLCRACGLLARRDRTGGNGGVVGRRETSESIPPNAVPARPDTAAPRPLGNMVSARLFALDGHGLRWSLVAGFRDETRMGQTQTHLDWLEPKPAVTLSSTAGDSPRHVSPARSLTAQAKGGRAHGDAPGTQPCEACRRRQCFHQGTFRAQPPHLCAPPNPFDLHKQSA